MSELLTQEQFLRVLPKKMKGTINVALIDNINKTIQDPILRESYRDNLLSYTKVMADGKFKIQQYLDAVRYVSFKLFGSSNIEAYTKTFPERYQRFCDQDVSAKDISSYVAAYNKTKLVNLIYAETLIPTHILNADLYQRALNRQAVLMDDETVSDKVRSDAANSLLTHLKIPEAQKVELDITVKEDSAIADLRATTQKLVAAQAIAISSGAASAQEIAHSKLEVVDVEAEYEDVTPSVKVVEDVVEQAQITREPKGKKLEEEMVGNFGGFSNA